MGAMQNGQSVEGEYDYTGRVPMAEGFEENVEFFTMTYEAPRPVAHNRPSRQSRRCCGSGPGRRDADREGKARLDVADTYAVLFDLDASQGFLAAVAEAESVHMAFIVTDDDRGFQWCAANCQHVWKPCAYTSRISPTSRSTRARVAVRYTLKDYQNDAVADVLARLKWARDDWHQRKSPVAFSLTATTGAGKTVMAASVIEALFDGNPDYDFESDPGAVVLWFTDDPSLNEQTRFRLLDAADQIAHSRLVVIENTFNREKLQPGNVYFLNAQKLGKKSLLVRGAPESTQEEASTCRCRCRTLGRSRCGTRWRTPSPTIASPCTSSLTRPTGA